MKNPIFLLHKILLLVIEYREYGVLASIYMSATGMRVNASRQTSDIPVVSNDNQFIMY